MPYQNEVQPLNLFGDFLKGKQAALGEREAQQMNALRGVQLQRAQGLNALAGNPNATPEQYVRAGDTAGGTALAGMQQQTQLDKQQALARVGGIAKQALSITDLTQRKGFLQQALTAYGKDFQALGADLSQYPQMLAMPDDALTQKLQQVAQFAAPQKPIEIAAGGTLALPNATGTGFTSAFTAPNPGQEETARHNLATEANAALTARNAAQANQLTNDTKLQNIVGKLRDDYTGIVKSTGWPNQQGFYQRLKSVGKDATGASDLALVFSFMKVLDPDSAVREGEYANAQNTAGIPGWVTAQYNKALSGEILSPDQRSKFMGTADKIYNTALARQEKIKTDFSAKAARAGVNPQDVLVDFGASPAAPEAGTGAVTATGPNGQKLVLQNGQWVPQ